MHQNCLRLAAWFLVLCPASVATAQPAADKKAEIHVERDIVFGRGGDTPLQLDLALPRESTAPCPAVICIHGGAWKAGKRQDLAQTIEVLAQRGFAAATISYRLVPSAQYPAQIEDCKAAVRWLRANAKKYNVNPDRVGAIGFSAGAHLCCLLGTTEKKDGLEGTGGNPEQSSSVQAVVSFFGPTDFTVRNWSKELEQQVLMPFLGGSFDDKSEAYRQASPIVFARKNAPPFLFFHGSEDQLVGVRHSKLLCEKLQSLGGDARVVILEGEGHGWRGEKLTKTVEEMMGFLDERLKK